MVPSTQSAICSSNEAHASLNGDRSGGQSVCASNTIASRLPARDIFGSSGGFVLASIANKGWLRDRDPA